MVKRVLVQLWSQLALKAKSPPPSSILLIFVCYSSLSFLVIRNLTSFLSNFFWAFLKTLVMEPIGLDGQNVPFSRLNDPRSSSPSLFVIWISMSNDPGVGKPLILLIFVCYSSPSFMTLAIEQLSLTAKKAYFQGQTSLGAVHGFLVIRNFDIILPIFFRTSVKTLDMEAIGPNGQNGPLSRSNEPQSSLLSFCMNFTIFLVIQNFNVIFFKKKLWTFIKTLAIEPVGADRQNDPFSRWNDPQSSLLSFLVIWKFDVIFPKNFMDVIPPFCLFFYAIVHHLFWDHEFRRHFCQKNLWTSFTIFFGDPKFRHHFCLNFSWTSVKNLAMEPIIPNGQNQPISMTMIFDDLEF
ncbi:hypothetical protein H5410_052994 [Solanum commersonii]|uniref:Uncharacterized protein n=1 Tax=Solanum commersonii TaxID=4109 RepID=A0A9J5X3Q5_SOLCO|nr:hypothetical protein H5410_052994 [Solanum commersonii]